MDLSSLSDADLSALSKGDLKSMSDAGFASLLKTREDSLDPETKRDRNYQIALEKNNPVNSMSGGQKFAAAAGKALTDVGRAVTQPFGGITRQQVDEIKQRDAPLMDTLPGKAGYIAGTGAVALPVMFAPGANTFMGGALYGAGVGAATPVGEGDSVIRNAAFGAAGGAAGATIPNMLSRVIAPKPQQGVRTMLNADVPMTPGQRLGGDWKRVEDAMTSVPGLGDAIRNAQSRGIEGFNAAVADRALAPIKAKLPKGLTGRDAISYTETAIGKAYDSALSRIGAVRADGTFANEITSLRNMVRNSTMPAEVQAQFDRVLTGQIAGKFQGQNAMTGQTFKEVESELGRLAAKYAADPSVDKQLLGDALQEVQASMRRLAERSAGPDVASDLKAANRGWAEFKRMQRASSMLGARDGVFSPENYMNAVKALDRSKDKGAFARGNALGQDFGADALNALGKTVPDSGTPFRTLAANPIQGLVSGAITSPLMALYSSPRALNALQIALSPKRPALATKAAAELEMAAPLLNALGITGATAYRSTSQK